MVFFSNRLKTGKHFNNYLFKPFITSLQLFKNVFIQDITNLNISFNLHKNYNSGLSIEFVYYLKIHAKTLH